jgi:hypothetical protein
LVSACVASSGCSASTAYVENALPVPCDPGLRFVGAAGMCPIIEGAGVVGCAVLGQVWRGRVR